MRSSDSYEKGISLTDEYISAFLKAIDCYIMGSKTYEHALELGWPYGTTPVFVTTKRTLDSSKKSVKFYSGDLSKLVNENLKPKYHDIWMVGGSALTKTFLKLQLADEIVVTIVPVILGDGIPFFDSLGMEQKMHLKDVQAFDDGMVELSYEIIHE